MNFWCWKKTLKVRILQSLRWLFIILVGLTMTSFSEKMFISNRCLRGLMPNSKNLLRSLVMHQFLCQQSIAVCNHAADLVIIPNNWLQPWCSNTSSGWSVRDLYLCCHFKGFDELMKAWESCLKHMVHLVVFRFKHVQFKQDFRFKQEICSSQHLA